MNIDEISKVVNLFKESGIDELFIEEKGLKIKLKNNFSKIIDKESIVYTETKQSNKKIEKEISNDEETLEGKWITAPFVGTFYEAISEGAQPFVKVGDEINKGDVLCILEAMKVMNEIKSDISGKVLKINAENGKMVEYGENLFLIGEWLW